ncbi:uncharacterized protein [Centruroides vittatus]|uniref:uncharacterized protein n=1 Tax=Centruroides vittatus TaxID=120091 RepID=UPI00351093D2
MIRFVIIQLAFLTVALAENIVTHNCSSAAQNFSMSHLSVDHLPIKIGNNVTINFDAKSLMNVQEGTKVEVSVTYILFTLSCSNYEKFCFDVCKIVKEGSVDCLINGQPCKRCPIKPGNVQVRHLVVETPSVPLLPDAKVTITVQAFDPKGNLLGCVKADNVPVSK